MIDFSDDIDSSVELGGDNGLWVSKHRPATLDEMCLDDNLRATFRAQIDSGDVQNMTLLGQPGTGKTTLALVLANEINGNVLFVSCASGDGRVEAISSKIIPFCQYSSPNRKIVILDELDSASATQANSFQKALRNVIEAYPDCRFIATANYAENVIPPILSRLPVVRISFGLQSLASRMSAILKEEGVDTSSIDKEKFRRYLVKMIRTDYPDIRAMFGKLQSICTLGLTDEKIDAALEDDGDGECDKFFEKVVSAIKSEPNPMIMRSRVDSIITDAISSGLESLSRFVGGYEFAKGLFNYVVSKSLLNESGLVDTLISLASQLNVVETCIDKEIQVFKMCLILKKSLK